MSDAGFVSESFDEITAALAEVFGAWFGRREAGELRIRRVTKAPPETISETPWLYWVADTGDVEQLTFATDVEYTPRRRRQVATFGAQPEGTVRRPKVQVTHSFKAQLLVCPRRDLAKDEELARPFIEPVILVMQENLTLDGRVERCWVTSYRYGVLPFGRLEERAREFMGIEFLFEAVVTI